MRNCLLSKEEKQYNPETEFVIYSIEQKEGSRFLAYQYQRGHSDEHFSLIKLTPVSDSVGPRIVDTRPAENVKDSKSETGSTQNFKATVNIISEEDLTEFLVDSNARYHMNIVSKKYLESTLNIFEAIGVVRASGVTQALKHYTDKIKQLTSLDINPIEITLFAAERLTTKKPFWCVVS